MYELSFDEINKVKNDSKTDKKRGKIDYFSRKAIKYR